jgi:cytochrome c oxidase subunit IV
MEGRARGHTRNVVVAAALFGLAAVSYGLSAVRLGGAALPIAVALSIAKATLVVLFFMELLEHRASSRVALLAALLLVTTLIALTAADVLTRGAPLP